MRFTDRRAALRCVERLATEVHDFARHPDICLLDGDRVRVAVANPNRVGVTLSELRLVAKVDAVIDGDVRALPRPAAAGAAVAAARGDSHDHALQA